jgi:hypothetical protein
MPLPAALVIWDHSIAAAAQYGPLASYLVAGHFYKLLSDSEQANDPLAVAWLTAKRKLRTTWLDSWVRADPSHTLEYAKRAQHMLLIANLFSLWLCCEAPVGAGQQSILGQSTRKLQTSTLFDRFKFAAPEFKAIPSPDAGRVIGLHWTITVQPYPCQTEPLTFSAQSIAAPAVHYASWQELQAASWPVDLRWRLVPGE